MTDRRFIDELVAELRARHRSLVDSPFVESIAKGQATRDDLLGWALRWFPVVRAIPDVMRLVRDRAAPSGREFLTEAVEEEGAGEHSRTKSHPELFLDFVEALGHPRELVAGAEPPQESAAFVAFRWRNAGTLPWYVAIAPNVIAEGEIPRAYRPMIEGFQRHSGLATGDLAFFTVHEDVDDDHAAGMADLIAAHAVSAGDPEMVRDVFWEASARLRRVWDGYKHARRLPAVRGRE